MILKETVVNLSDKSGLSFIKIFHLYQGFKRKHSTIGLYVKGSVKLLKKKKIKKIFTKLAFKKGNIVKSLIVRQAYNINKTDGSAIRFHDNSVITVKKKNSITSKYLIGPGLLELRKKKILLKFKNII